MSCDFLSTQVLENLLIIHKATGRTGGARIRGDTCEEPLGATKAQKGMPAEPLRAFDLRRAVRCLFALDRAAFRQCKQLVISLLRVNLSLSSRLQLIWTNRQS